MIVITIVVENDSFIIPSIVYMIILTWSKFYFSYGHTSILYYFTTPQARPVGYIWIEEITKKC